MRRFFLPVLACLALSGCAIGGAPEPEATPYAPSFAPVPEAGAAADDADGSSRTPGDRGDRGGRDAADGRGGDRDAGTSPRGEGRGQGRARDGGNSGAGNGGAAAPQPTTSARTTDARGDVSGVETPAWSDLVAAQLRREASGWTLQLEMAGAVPATTTGDRVLDLTLWVDRDGDGAVDDEVLAQLGEDGWTTAYRDPDRARYGADSEVEVRSEGSEVLVTMPAGHLGGVERLQWAVSAELGTLSAMTTGTSSRDTAPDAGATAFPG